MADTDWVQDPTNPNRMTFTGDDGVVHEAIRQTPAPQTAPTPPTSADNPIDSAKDSYMSAAMGGLPGTIASAYEKYVPFSTAHTLINQRFPGLSYGQVTDMAGQLTNQARSESQQELDAKASANQVWQPGDSTLYGAARVDRWLPKLLGNVASNAQYMLGAGSGGAVTNIAGTAVGAGSVDAIDQASKVGLGQQDHIDTNELAQNTAMGGLFGAGSEALGFVGLKVLKYLKDEYTKATIPEAPAAHPEGWGQYSADDEAKASQLFKTGTADDIRSYSDYLFQKYGRGLDTSGTDAYVAARDKGVPVDTTLKYPEGKSMETQSNRVDPVATKAAAQELLTKHPVDTDLGAVNHAVDHPDEVEQEVERQAAQTVQQAVSSNLNPTDAERTAQAQAQAVLDRGARRDAAIEHINKVTAPWQDAPEFIVHSDFRDMGAGTDVPHDAYGYYDPETQQVHVNVARLGHDVDADGMQIPGSINKDNLSALIYHEGLGHYGLDKTFGDGLTDLVTKLDQTNPKFSKAIDDWQSRNPDVYADRENARALAAEEVFARQSELGIRNPSTFSIAKAYVKNMGRRLGLDLKYSDGEINTILGIAHQGVVAGRTPRLNFYRSSLVPRSGTGDTGYRTSNDNEENHWGNPNDPVTPNPSGMKPFDQMNSRDLRALASKGHPTEDLPDWGNEEIKPGSDLKPFDELNGKELRALKDQGPRFSLKDKGIAASRDEAASKLTDVHMGQTGIVERPEWSYPDSIAYQFKHITTDGKTISGSYRVNGDGQVHSMDIGRSYADGVLSRSNSVGLPAIRQIGRDILAKHPDSQGISGYRLSGARPEPVFANSGKRFSTINPDKIKTEDDIDNLLKANSTPASDRAKTWEDTESEALARGINPSAYLKGKSLTESAAILEQGKQVLTQGYENLSKLWNDYEKNGFSADLYDRAMKQAFVMRAVHSKLEGDISGTARALNILKKETMSREFAKGLSKQLNDTGIPAFDDPEAFYKFMQNLGDHVRNGDPDAGSNFISKSTNAKFNNIAQRVWFNGMLSGLSTHVKIPLSSTLHMLVDTTARLGAVPEGALRSAISGDNAIDKTTLSEVGYRIRGLVEGLRNMDNWSAARQALNTGQTGDRVFGNTAAGAYTGSNPIKGFVSGFLESGTRLSAGEEELIRNVFRNSSLYGEAARQATKEGFSGKSLEIRMQQIMNDPSPAILNTITNDTKVLQFHDASGPMGSTIKYAIQRVPVLKVLAPMVSISDRVMSSMVRYGPAPISALDRYNRPGLNPFNASQEAQVARSRMVLGSAMFGFALMAAANGEITGEGPGDPQRRADWLVNHQPNSIRIGNQWHSYAGLGEPLAGPLSMAASTYERARVGEIDYTKDLRTATEHLLTGWGSSILGSGPLHNFSQIVEAQTPDETRSDHIINSLTAGVVSSFVPAVARRYAQSSDPRITDTRGNGFDETVGNRLKSEIPGKTQDLPQRNDVIGNPEYREPSILSTLTGSNTKTITDDPVAKEIDRLDGMTSKPIIGTAKKGQVIDPVTGVKRPMTQWEYQAYQGLSGQYIHNYISGLMHSGEWQKMSDEDKVYDLHGGKPGESDKGAIAEARQAAHEKLFNQQDQ